MKFNFCFVLFFVLSLNLGLRAQDMKIKFVNKTGGPIDSLLINGQYIGHLDKDSTSAFISYPQVWSSTGYFMLPIRAWQFGRIIKDRKPLTFTSAYNMEKKLNGSMTLYLRRLRPKDEDHYLDVVDWNLYLRLGPNEP